jgi:glucose-6-phosphate 1-dehydrogenase
MPNAAISRHDRHDGHQQPEHRGTDMTETSTDPTGSRPARGDALVVFGLTGDLGHDELLPAIVLLHATGRLGVPVIGVGRTAPDDVDGLLRDAIDDELARRAGATVDEIVDAIDLRFVAGDATEASTWDAIADVLGDARQPTVYAALPPALLGDVAASLSTSKLPDTTRLALEKPFGDDRESAAALYDEVTSHVDASRLFLVDHFLAKAPLRSLPVTRSSPVLDAVLRAGAVRHVTIDFPEPGGLEGRG